MIRLFRTEFDNNVANPMNIVQGKVSINRQYQNPGGNFSGHGQWVLYRNTSVTRIIADQRVEIAACVDVVFLKFFVEFIAANAKFLFVDLDGHIRMVVFDICW